MSELHETFNDTPQRLIEVRIAIGVDSEKDLQNELRYLAHKLAGYDIGNLNDNKHTSVTGGPNSGSIIEIRFNPGQTHDEYFRQIEEELAEIDS